MHETVLLRSYGLSPSQTRNLVEDALSGGEWGLNVEQVVCTTTEALNIAAFRKSWQTIVDQHSALRVAFKRDEQKIPYQEIQLPMEVPLLVEDRREVSEEEKNAFVEDWLERDRQTQFTLSVAPLLRFTVFRFGDQSATWVWTFHHILMDGRSFLLVLEDFFTCYESICARNQFALPRRKHFAEFISWHQSWLESEQKLDETFWAELFSNDEADSILSIARTNAPADHRQKKLTLDTSSETSDTLHRLAGDLGVTVNTIIQGTWALLLSRYYRSPSLTFSTIRSCRQGSVEGAEEMIGMLMNLLPVHVHLSPETSVADFLKEIRAQQLAMRAHQWAPWEAIRNFIPVAARKQFFDSCVLYERHQVAQEMTDRFGLQGMRTFSLRERSNIPLLLSVSEKPFVQFDLIYLCGMFEEAEIAQLGRSFVALLHQVIAKPAEPIGALASLNPQDKAEVLQRLCGPDAVVPEDKGLHEWFEEQARKSPDDLAIVAETSLTYRELDHQSTQLATRLANAGVSSDQVIAIFLPRSALSLVAILGVLKSGSAYLPINTAIPKARITGLLEDSKASAVITDEIQSPFLPVLSIPLILAENLDDGTKGFRPGTPHTLPQIRGSHLAYVMPTSGTTGRPKLIGVEHRQASNLLAYATGTLLQRDDVRWVPFIDSPSFDSSISQIFTTLALGGTLVEVGDILAISQSPYYDRFTCLGSTPTLLATILKTTGLPPAVRLIGLGAETIPADLLEKLDHLPQVRKVLNYYGPSEATVYCTVALTLDRTRSPDAQSDSRNRGRIIGRPIANTRLYLVDEFGQLVPPGAMGELFIAGAPVARGYLNLKGKENESFLVNAFTAKSERMYRSGDIASLRGDGQLEFHGRKDHQLKFNGVRIEATEIENALLGIPGVRQTLVDLRSDAEGKKRLVAYLVADGENFSRQKLRKILRLLLPGAMIPQHFVVLNELPVTSNGKVDREALARLEIDLEPPIEASVSATPMEIAMRDLWERNLSRSPIGLDQDYFELGGDSLSAVNLLLAIEIHFGVRIKAQNFAENSTISELVHEVELGQSAVTPEPPNPAESLVPLQGVGKQTPLILIPGGSAEGFLSYKNFAQSFFPDHPVHVLQSPYRLMIDERADPVTYLANHFARQIASLVKDRPFVLFGHCVGGLLAWHVACALREGTTPPFKLVIYDAPVARKGGMIPSLPSQASGQSRLKRATAAYRTAWREWRTQHGDDWRNRVAFLGWALKNVVMRKGWDRSESGRDNFAKLLYLRALQSHSLEVYSHEALLIYHQVQAPVISKKFWQSRSRGQIHFEFISGDHDDWESAILNTVPLIRAQLVSYDAAEKNMDHATSSAR